MDEAQTRFAFDISHIPGELRGFYESFLSGIESILTSKSINHLEFFIGLSIFELTDILFQHKGAVGPVDIVNFYHKCTTEAIIEMVLMDEDKLDVLLTDARTLGEYV